MEFYSWMLLRFSNFLPLAFTFAVQNHGQWCSNNEKDCRDGCNDARLRRGLTLKMGISTWGGWCWVPKNVLGFVVLVFASIIRQLRQCFRDASRVVCLLTLGILYGCGEVPICSICSTGSTRMICKANSCALSDSHHFCCGLYFSQRSDWRTGRPIEGWVLSIVCYVIRVGATVDSLIITPVTNRVVKLVLCNIV